VTIQIHRSDYPDYMSYLDAIGGAMNPAVWDEDEQEWVLNPEWVAEQERRERSYRERPARRLASPADPTR
jgi:hypothetical protein